ncbi:hypothetical protein LINPERHAP2_LOCUS20905 [Linum perenne]
MFGGPWMVGEHYVVIQDWRPYFQPEDSPISTLRVWVRLPGVPLEYYDAAILTIIGNRIGKTVRLDETTLEGSGGNFSRICVEVDLSKPLLSKYRLRRRVQHIEYEGLHTICFSCGCYEHTLDHCTTKENAETAVAPDVMVANPTFQNRSMDDPRPEVEEDFGPWMKVKSSNRKGKKFAPVKASPTASSPMADEPILGKKNYALSGEDCTRVNGGMAFQDLEGVNNDLSVRTNLADADKENCSDLMDIVVNGVPQNTNSNILSVSETVAGPRVSTNPCLLRTRVKLKALTPLKQAQILERELLRVGLRSPANLGFRLPRVKISLLGRQG